MRTKIFSFDDTNFNQRELREKAFIVLKSLIEADLIINIQFTHEDSTTVKLIKLFVRTEFLCFQKKNC